MSQEPEPAPPGKPVAASTTTAAPATAAPQPSAPTTPPAPAFPAKADYVGKIPIANGVITLEITVEGDKADRLRVRRQHRRVVAARARGERHREPGEQGQDQSARGSPRRHRCRRDPVDRREAVGLHGASPPQPPAGLYVYSEDAGSAAAGSSIRTAAVTGVLRLDDGSTVPAPDLETRRRRRSSTGVSSPRHGSQGGSDV